MLEELPRRVGVALHEASKLPEGGDEGLQIGVGSDRRRAHPVPDERDLAEVVSRAEDAQILPADGDPGRAVGDDEEPDPPLVPLLDDDRPRRERPLRERVGEPPQLLLIQAGEEGDAAQRLDRVDRHVAIVRCRVLAV